MKIETKTIHYVDYNDLDESISEFLKEKGAAKTDFEIVAYHELMNDVSKTFTVGGGRKVDQQTKQEILKGKLHWRTAHILDWMHEEGKIPAGEYLVEISW